ncbi:MAG TPA: HAD-IIIA family hydrolase [Candidatus Paceibacterota bacterium]|nr:HAD-IIIA family hydrolase [Candidatus Paceibacterota bacterium]
MDDTIALAFLDQDGVITKEVHHLHRMEDLEILPNVAKAIRAIRAKGFKIAVITNQAAVAKGIVELDQVLALQKEIVRRLADEGAVIDGYFYCPHHPQGTVEPYNRECDCRKPEPGMFKRAAVEFQEKFGKKVDFSASVTVGDKTGDILAGQAVGTRTVLVETGYGGKDGVHEATPDFVAKDLFDAVQYF